MYWNFTDIVKRADETRLSRSDGTLLAEIGFGNGEFLERLALSRSDALVVGIEVSRWCAVKAARRALAGGIENVRILLGDARYLLKWAFVPACLSEAFMNFPCPWPKRRHAPRRIATSRFASLIGGALELGGSFTLATDVEWYAQETRDIFVSDGYFETGTVELAGDLDCLTKYGRKWRDMGRETYLLTARKTKERPPTAEGETILDEISEPGEPGRTAGQGESGTDVRGRLSPLVGETVRGANHTIIFRELFLSDDGSALLSVITVDEGFEQHFFVRVVPGPSGIKGKIDPTGHPYKTPGVRTALRHMTLRSGVVF
ncbi:MAG: tRNA (guanosine(46)-N7)-methyltransferase TrmB [Synergistaceae bacterium]|jgi:tRNA (guanine-N7-)-methyltransferase|nr:tRNA (guanosine(46)-N7)-methyltransferase TrmB [Synergistaceae bacterium]